jgi:hypothetical protein
MGFFKKKADPISARSKALNAQIASLEAQINKLNVQLQQSPPQPRMRSTALPRSHAAADAHRSPPAREPVFEPVDHRHLEPAADAGPTPGHYNDLGVRKYDLAAAWQRVRNYFRPRPSNNSKLVTYLAAGSIRGLRPLRYEKRVARNRFIALLLILVAVVWGIISFFIRR